MAIAANDHGNPGSYFSPDLGEWAIPVTDLKARWQVLPDGLKGEYLTDRLTEKAIGFIRRQGDQPFFLYLSQDRSNNFLGDPRSPTDFRFGCSRIPTPQLCDASTGWYPA